ncbi:P-loop NTPase fold protein [Aeromicrobium sp.]|uniref:KAP family P-loop NTPase fold protein n=1 Tax=Aeromicrobium sp. TaxID=1871063 RepID=UPI0028B0B2DA|nr:P-loop NTPase fold protein [Aeromicrobium sp.]
MRFRQRKPDGIRTPRTLDRKTKSLYADDADGLDRDVLSRKRLATQLARAIRDLAEETESAVVGLVGPWGSGKSSLLGQIETDLDSTGWYIGHHNPWAYSDFAGSAAGFFASLRDAVPEDVLGKEWRATVGEWVSKAAPLGAAGGVAGIDGSGAIGAVGAVITGDRSPARLREVAAEGLSKIDQPVIMILDDLDRLAPDELLYTFKLVRLLGRLPNVYYLLAYDEGTLTDLLEATDLVGEGSGRAQQYLEKIIQVRLEIPPMLPEQQAALANAAIDEICARRDITLSAGATKRLQTVWQDCLVPYLDQPRSVKRLFTQVDATWPDVAGEVDFSDFVAITFLRVFERRTLDLIMLYRAEILRQPSGFTFERHKESQQERWKRWRELIAGANPRHPAEIEKLLAHLFIYLRGAKDGTEYVGSSYHEDVSRRMGVGTAEHFDRYVQVGVPESDLSELAVRAAADEIRAGAVGAATHKLLERMNDDASPALRKLRREHQASPLPAATTLPLLGAIYLAAMDQKSGLFGLSPNFGVIGLAMDVLDQEDSATGSALIESLARTDLGSLALAAEMVRMALKDSETPHSWAPAAKAPIVDALADGIRSFASQPARTLPRFLSFVFDHFHLAGAADTRELLWEHINSGSWDLSEVLGLLIPLGQASNGEDTWTSMGDFSEGTIEDVLGVDEVLARLPERPDLLERQDQSSYFDRRVDAEDLQARIEYALTGMERVRVRRRQEIEADAGEDISTADGEDDPA